MEHRIDRIDPEAVAATPAGATEPLLLVRGAGGRIFHRRGRRLRPDGSQATESWLVGELAGVRLYFDGAQFVLTQLDLYP